jgi:outer membrane protein OmpA-like peptidoglycan-associated protein
MANGGGPEAPKDLTDLLKGWLSTAAATLVSAIVSVGFVAFAGKAVLWTRFTVLQVPAEQVVKAVPQSEAVATGASILLIFGFFGAIAVVALYLVDRGGRATLGMSRMLLALVTLEGVATVVLAGQVGGGRKVGVGLVLLLAIAAIAFGLTFVSRLINPRDTLRSRPSEALPPAPPARALLNGQERPLSASVRRLVLLAAPLVVALALVVTLLLVEMPAWATVAEIVAILGLVAVEVRYGVVVVVRIWEDAQAERERDLAYDRALDEKAKEEDAQWTSERRSQGEEKRKEEEEKEREKLRTGKRRPNRFGFTVAGGFVLALLAFVAIALPALILEAWWFAVSIGTAIVLAFGLWRIACLSKRGFIWFGLAVFLSVPLFGALTLMARNFGRPQAQPVAIIRKTDGPDEVIQGLYVAEAEKRVYFANVATEGCEDKLKRHSGRLLWVPSDEVVAMSVGPLQDVDDAGRAALEMAYALTPAVETPAAGAVSLTVAEKRTRAIKKAEAKREAKEVEEHAPGLDQRLQNPGPAVRPDFGFGLSLVPEVASPGEWVELRLKVPNGNVDGFGHRREGHTLRLNGVPLAIKREATSRASNAEYVETEDGQRLTLDKEGVYGRDEASGKPVLITDESQYGKGPRFVKLEDKEVEMVHHGGFGSSEYSEYLKVRGKNEVVELAGKKESNERVPPEVKLSSGGSPVRLKKGFVRQAWSEDSIVFKVPRHAKSGVIAIDCGQLAGSPLLRVATPPVARIEARMRGGSKRVVFDGRRSRDAAGERLVDRWKLGGHSLGKHERVSLRLRPRRRPYRVRLTVTDPQGVAGTAELLLLRLPESFFEFGSARPQKEKALKKARRALKRLARRHPPSSIELDGNADDVGTASFNLALSLHRAERVRKVLLAPRAQTSTLLHASIPVTVRAFGESCPIVRAPGRQQVNRRVDVFVIDPGDTIAAPKGCKAGKEERSRW